MSDTVKHVIVTGGFEDLHAGPAAKAPISTDSDSQRWRSRLPTDEARLNGKREPRISA